MARKHLPLKIGGAQVEITGKGFRIITRDDGEREVWWYAAKRAVKRGYHPKTIRLYGALDSLSDVQKMFDRCNDLWTEMLDWLAAGELDNRPIYDGTVGATAISRTRHRRITISGTTPSADMFPGVPRLSGSPASVGSRRWSATISGIGTAMSASRRRLASGRVTGWPRRSFR